ncbi:MAG: hypothetical protein HY040_01390 [Planctomycetes bacterium]|nr:hypothetical protein [Planctomycetota bacterium]
MPDEQPSLEERFAAVDERVKRLQKLLPPPEPPKEPARRRDPLESVQTILIVFIFAGICLLFRDAIDSFGQPDSRVFVSVEEGKFQVWRNADTFEKTTGKPSHVLPREATQDFVTFHDQKRERALEGVSAHAILLIASVLALRYVRRTRRELADLRAAIGSEGAL